MTRETEIRVPALGLRPAKLRNAARRRWFEHRLSRLPVRATRGLVELGTAHGGWTVPGELVRPSWVCYSVGAGGDVSFDLELIRRYGVRVRFLDAVGGHVEDAIREAAGEPRFSAHQAAITLADGPVRMQRSQDPRSRSVSSAGLDESDRHVELPGRSLASLMSEHGDERIDLLKLDIAGGEYKLLPRLDLRRMGVKVLSLRFHHAGTLPAARILIARLDVQGYDAVAVRPVVKLTFARRELLDEAVGLGGRASW